MRHVTLYGATVKSRRHFPSVMSDNPIHYSVNETKFYFNKAVFCQMDGSRASNCQNRDTKGFKCLIFQVNLI